MILGVGIDLLHLPRLVGLVRRQGGPSRLARRILSPLELAEFEAFSGSSKAAGPNDQGNASATLLKYLAVRWTAKEAAYKALYPHLKLTWKDVSVVKTGESVSATDEGNVLVDDRGKKPALTFHRSVPGTKACENVKMHLSVSHDGDYVTSIVVAEQT